MMIMFANCTFRDNGAVMKLNLLSFHITLWKPSIQPDSSLLMNINLGKPPVCQYLARFSSSALSWAMDRALRNSAWVMNTWL